MITVTVFDFITKLKLINANQRVNANEMSLHWLTHWSLGRCCCENFKHNLGIDILSIQVNITFEWITEDPTAGNSTLGQVMAWCHQATSHYLNQCWPRSLINGITRPQWLNHQHLICIFHWFASLIWIITWRNFMQNVCLKVYIHCSETLLLFQIQSYHTASNVVSSTEMYL